MTLELESFIDDVVSKPEVGYFISVRSDTSQIFINDPDKKAKLYGEILEALTKTFNYSLSVRNQLKTTQLDELITEGADTEQIWEQIQLHHRPLLTILEKKIEQESDKTEEPLEIEEQSSGAELEEDLDSEDIGSEGEEGEEGDVLGEEDEDDEEEEEERRDAGRKKKASGKKGELDDDFFSLDKMNDFLKDQEERELDGEGEEEEEGDPFGEEEGIDNYEDFFDEEGGERQMEEEEDEDEDGEAQAQIEADFWRQANRGKKKLKEGQTGLGDLLTEQEMEEEDDRELGSLVTRHSEYLRTLEKKMKKLEETNVGEKTWELTGEVHAGARPVNSLLEADLDFQALARPPPIITEAVTDVLEDIIKKAVIDETYDDVVRRRIIDTNIKKRFVLDDKKSKLSLAEIYENEYLEASGGGKKSEQEEKVNPQHEKIQRTFDRLCAKLNALCNFHYAPKVNVDDVEISQKNSKSILMEEIVPTATSNQTLLTASEVYRPATKSQIQILRGKKEKGEASQEELARLRAAKKNAGKLKEKEKAQKEKEREMKDPLYASRAKQGKKGIEKATKEIKQHRNVKIVGEGETGQTNVSTSAGLFKQLQEEARQEANEKKAKKIAKKQKVDSAKYKM
ncbi:hypothetical protein PROFUN_02213 [Planoprotostelium fungivorum]|uniref:U3 small nucleolar ribonucleoprotein protein MPP10 n=1 Tax=Planoprotostelium fungivorum TaxID=1890364 RepID=A0A2P6NZI6_9EUKA|nr:hypothetical protein PROFUN_02213 [Planoprotostelium fungivorum]